MILRLGSLCAGTQIVNLISDLPPFRPDLAAYLLPALVRDVPQDTLLVCVVDPGVGGERGVLALEADGRWYVGPDNGLLSIVARRAGAMRMLRVKWRPERMSASFHGRDLFCPMAAMLVQGVIPDAESLGTQSAVGADWPDELATIVYVDGYGNLMTGVRADRVPAKVEVQAGGRRIAYARTFCEVPAGTPFWYENSFGLVELAVSHGRADETLGLGPGESINLSGAQSAEEQQG
jgi:S-adenosylmethionine hydrolase